MRVEKTEGLAWRTIGDETFVVDLRAKWMYGLNRSGGEVWQQIVDCEDPWSFSLRLVTDNSRERCATQWEQSVTTFILELRDLGLVHESTNILSHDDDEPPANVNFEAPAIIWKEELRAFAGSCLFDNPFNCPNGPTT